MPRRPPAWSLTALRGWLLALLVALAPAAPGAPGKSGADTPARSGTAGIEDAAAPEPAASEAQDGDPRAERDGGPSPEVFVPSEDISEDFAVPFPVDI